MKVLTVLSGKGGTGTTAVAANLAAVAAMRGANTLLVDFHNGARALDLAFGVQDRAIYHTGDVRSGALDLEDAVLRIPGLRHLSLLSGDPDSCCGGPESEALDSVGELIRSCARRYDLTVIDAGSGWSPLIKAITAVSDLSLLVTTPDRIALRATEALEDRMIRSRVMNRRYLVNRVIPALVFKGIEPEVQEINTRIRCEMAGMVLDDENIRAAMGIGAPVVLKQDSYIAENFRKIAERLLML
ncbi:MAG: AAA family ATPase [Mogibacterium sp.]|nr:AAA family ATPase [Mogibacterium sp.]